MVDNNKKLPDKYVLDTKMYDRLELLTYDLHAIGVLSEEEREQKLADLDMRYGYTRRHSEYPELEEFYLKVYHLLPAGEDNLWYWGINVADYDEHLEMVNRDWYKPEPELIFEYAAARAYQVFLKMSDTEHAEELKKWYLEITDPDQEKYLMEPYLKINW